MFSTKDKNVKEKEIEREERALKIQKIKGTVDKYTRIKTKLSIKVSYYNYTCVQLGSVVYISLFRVLIIMD